MTIYFSTNIPEMRSIFQLNRSSNKIADISHRLETGQRINSGKDDPEGLIIRDRLRADIKGLYTAKDNASRADNMLSIADSGLASLQKYILGEKDDGTSGLKALIGSVKSSSADSDALKANISQILDQMNGVARSTTYNGKQIINGDLAYKTAFTSDEAKLSNLNISKANGGNQAVNVTVTAAATKTQGKLGLTAGAVSAEQGDSITVRYNGTAYKYTIGTNDLSGSGNEVSLTTLAEKVGTMLKGSGLNVTTDTSGITYDLVLEADNFGSSNTLFITLDSNSASGTGLTNATTTIIDGTDAVVTVNGNAAKVNGLHVSYTDSNGNLSLETDVANLAAGAAPPAKTSVFSIKSGGATFQIGKNVVADQQLKFGLTSANTSNLGGANGNLNDLLGLDYTNAADVKKASAIVDEAIDGINKQRGQIGFMQGSVLKPTTEYLEDNLTAVTAAEGNISNVDVAFESSRLAREELLANNAMNSVLFNRSYAQFLVSSLW